MNLPDEFVSNIQSTFREDGFAFLKALPDSIAEASARWDLTDVEPASTLSYNFVAFALSGASDSEPRRSVVLKMGVPDRERLSEMAALRLFNGEGACRLLDYDEEKCWMLLERLTPGLMLAEMENDEEATHIAAEVMKRIWRPVDHVTLSGSPDTERSEVEGAAKSLDNKHQRFFDRENRSLRMTDLHNFIQLTDWFDGLKKLRRMFNGGTGPLNEKLVERVEWLVSDFFIENHQPVLMHGDFHHYNILSSERGWLVIDPKGVIGPAGYEVGPFLMNPWGELINSEHIQQITKRRIDILHEHLGFERERLREWGLAHAVLSAWWGIEDNTGWEYSVAFAEMIAELELK